MDAEEELLNWGDEVGKHEVETVESEVICGLEHEQPGSYNIVKPESMIEDTDQMAAENLMFLSQDVVYTETAELNEDPNIECVTEEIITDDWVGGQDRVEVPLDQLMNPVLDVKEVNDIDVPLPTDQDEYTAMRPWPCDFCSRRFRKKAALMNHMVAHQNDRPHACNLCGVRYVRKCDLMNHLKVHAFVPDNVDSMDFDDNQIVAPKKKRGRRKKNADTAEANQNGVWENMTSARTQQWSRWARNAIQQPPATPVPSSPPSPPSPSPPSPAPEPSDPSRPFVCKHCGVGFAREKALQSHSRIHGGDSPLECGACGELCWSREALNTHARNVHPHLPMCAATRAPPPSYSDDEFDDMEYRLSPSAADSGSERNTEPVKGPELFCLDCGVAFQRADLLRRHQAAAHKYKRHDSSSSTWAEHTCEVCGESCPDALQLLAHAERHADRTGTHHTSRLKRGRGRSTTSSSSRQFPCRECGKVFGSRSSQQIHVRIHTGERPYACRFCWKAFADGGTLRKHERIHTGEKPYACAVCPRAFNQRVVLREHVRSHHSAPDKKLNGGTGYSCVVCGRTLHSSSELVQHLIQHCDANTAMKRQPQPGPRKYKRRRKIKPDGSPSRIQRRPWQRDSTSPARRGSTSPARSPVPTNSPSQCSTPPQVSAPRHSPVVPVYKETRRRRRRHVVPLPRPRMIHTEEPRPRIKQVRGRRPPRRPADDLRAIAVSSSAVTRSPTPTPFTSPAVSPSPVVSPCPAESPSTAVSPSPVISPSSTPSPPPVTTAKSTVRCEMCGQQFSSREELILHVPVHI